MINADTIRHLSSKYNVRPSIIRDLVKLSRTWQTATSEDFKAMTLRRYNMIVATKCNGIDPLV